jgi:hypothetical protein
MSANSLSGRDRRRYVFVGCDSIRKDVIKQRRLGSFWLNNPGEAAALPGFAEAMAWPVG